MPFETGNQLWKKGLEVRKERGGKIDQFLLMLGDDGVDAYGDLISKLANNEELSKPQQDFMDRYEGWREYFKPKLARVDNAHSGEVTIKVERKTHGDKDTITT